MVTNISSEWVSGSLVFYETAVGQSATGDVLTLGTAAVKVGGTTQDVDFQWYADGGKSFILDAGAGTLVTAGIDVTIAGDLTIDLEDIQIKDNFYLQFGDATGGDVSARWVSATSLLEILPATDNTGKIYIGNGTKDLDFRVFLGTAAAYVDFNVTAASLVISAGVTLSVDDTTASTNTTSGSIHTDGGLGVAGATYLGTILGLNSAASDIVLIANTAAALEFYDATTKFLVADTRNTVAADMLTITGIPSTITAAAGTTRRMLNIVPGTTTLTGQTGVTDMTGVAVYVTAPTITDSQVITVAEASTVEIAGAPAQAVSVTITKALAFKVASGKSMFAGDVDFGIDATGVDVTFFGDTTAYKVWFDQNGDTNGAWYFGADTKGIQVNLYGDVTGCGVFWDPTTDVNGTLTIGGSGGSKGNDVFMYGATNGAYLKWDQGTDALILAGAATLLSGAGAVGAPALQVGAADTGLYLVSATQTGVSQDGVLVAVFDSEGIKPDSVQPRVALGTAGAGTVTFKQYGDGRDITTVLTLTAFIIGAPGAAAAAKGFGNIVYAFPAGQHLELVSALSAIVLTAAGTAVASDTGLGSVVASGVIATLDGTATFEDRLTGQTINTAAGGGAAVSALKGATAGIGTGIALNVAASVKNVFLNSAGTWNEDNTGNLTATGTIVLKWTIMS